MLKSLFAGVLMVLASIFGLFHAPVATTATPTEPVTKVLTIVNHVSTTPITLLPNTRFETQDHLVFRASQAVTIPAKHGGTDGTVEVAVVATQPGAQYDIGSARLVLPGLVTDPALYTGVYAYTSGAASPTQATAALPSTFPVPSGSTTVATQTTATTRSTGAVAPSVRTVASDVQEPSPPSVLTAPLMSGNYVTKEELAAQLSATTNALRSLVYQNDSAPNSPPASGGYTNDIAVASTIDQLNGTTLNNVTINGISGITANEIPQNIVAANYLPLAGGTLTGALLNTATASSSFAGALGIGTTSPSDLFAVNGAVYIADITPPAVTTNRLYSNSGSLYWAGSLIGGASTGNWTSDGTNVWRTGGTVGIGTTSPSQALSVQGNVLVSGNLTASNVALGNATTTNTFATTASSTNLFAQVATLGSLIANSLGIGSLTATNSTTTNATTTNLFASNLIADGGTIYGADISGANVTSTGSAFPRTLAVRAADVVNVLDYGADPTGTTLSDAAFSAAIAAVLAKPYGGELSLPAGNFKLSAAQMVALSAQQGFLVEGQGPGITTITQTGQADAFDVQIAHYTTKNGQYVGFKNLSIVYANATPGSSAVNVTTSAAGGQQGNPLYFENDTFSGAWNYGININELPTETYVSNSTFFLSSNSTGISFQGNSTSGIYSVGLMLDNIASWGGYRFLYVGPYVQGVIARGLNVAAATQSIFWDASAGAGEQFVLSDSYLKAGVYLATSGSGSLTGVQISNNFFDGETASANELNVVGILQPQITGNVFFGTPTNGGTAVYFGSGASHGVISGNVFSGFEGGSGNGNGITLDTGANSNLVSQNNIINATTPVIDNGTSNTWQQNTFNGVYNFSGPNTPVSFTLSGVSQLSVPGFINSITGYGQSGNTILYASTTSAITLGGDNAGAGIIGMASAGSTFGVTAFGSGAMQNATTSQLASSAFGFNALKGSATISNSGLNSAFGYSALTANTSGSSNSAFGSNALLRNTTGIANTAVGQGSFLFLATASGNTALGSSAAGSLTGNGNTAIGANAGRGVGLNSYGVNTVNSTFLGENAGFIIATSTGNLFLGYSVASTTQTGNNNIAIGYDVGLPSVNGSNQLNIGNTIFGTGVGGEGNNILPTSNIAIGTSTPYARLEAWGPDAASSTLAFNVVNNASTTVFSVFDGGNAQLAGTLTQSSDQRLKTNVQPLDASSSLTLIEALNPVSFNWVNGIFGNGDQLGFIAQAVQSLFPQLVSTTSPTALTPDGTLGLNYTGLIAPIISAIQGIAHISGDFESNLIAWLGDASNGIQDLFAADIHAQNELCVGSTCVTPTQFQAMVTAAGQIGVAPFTSGQGSGGGSDSPATSTADTPPTIRINGDNPAIIYIGDTYSDLGATITGPAQDLNLGINVSVDGGATTTPDEISIDTSTSSTHTISYFATDQDGETGYATRSVVVEAATSTP